MNGLLEKYDAWLDNAGPAALVIREHLMPVEGHDGVLFPATYAASEDKSFKGGYNIDRFTDSANVCLIDSVGSQANRIEPLFLRAPYAGLVPQIVVVAGVAGDRRVNLLEAGHRAGDAIVRCSALQKDLQAAFRAVQKGDAEPLAKIAPTSLVFGAWDSRDTQAKIPRLIASTIRAFDVRELTRSAAYAPPVDHIAIENIPNYSNEKEKKKYSERGWLHAIPSGTPGGVIANAGIRRDATLHLAALRLLSANRNEGTLKLRRYILGLSLTAFTVSPSNYLRQGCNLVLNPEKPREFMEVYGDGRRLPVALTHDDALAYARATAREFGIDTGRDTNLKAYPDREVMFDKKRAEIDVSDSGDGGKKSKKTSAAKAK